VLLLDLSPLIHRLEKGKMHGGAARAHENLPSFVPQNAMTPDNKPSTAEDFSTKFSQCVNNVTPAATSYPVASAT
jgi:hypothetical protein